MHGGSSTNIYGTTLFGAAMEKTDKILFLVLQFSKATPFVVFVFCFFGLVSVLMLCSISRYASISLALYLDYLRVLFGVLLCLTV